MERFKDKVVVITGASRGIGRATALEFGREGARLVLDYFVSAFEPDALDNVQSLAKELEQIGAQSISIAGDVSDPEQVKALVDKTMEEFGRIDVLINNAGIVVDMPLMSRSVESWTETLATNLIGPFICSKAVAPIMAKQGFGRIVNVASTNGIDAFSPESVDYDASKAGLISLTKNLAQELAPQIMVNAIAPGWVDTAMNDQLPKEFKKAEAEKIYLKRFATPEEIARPILFLASEDAGYVTGQTLIVNGGM